MHDLCVPDGDVRLPPLPRVAAAGNSKSKSKYKGLRFEGLFLYTSGVLFHVEWCIRLTALMFFNHNL